MQALRKVVFYVLALVYLAVCPSIVMYSFGYIFDSKGKNVVQTGLVRIETIPKGATVLVDNVQCVEKTPLTMRGLLPGDYTVKVCLAGHLPWERRISVSTGKPVVYENVVLLPEKWEPREISARRFSRMIPLPRTSIILLSEGDSLGQFVVYDWKHNYMRPLVPAGEQVKAGEVLDIFTAEESDVVVVETSEEKRRHYTWIKIARKGSEIEDISHLFEEAPRRILWDPKAPSRLFLWQAEHLNSADVDMGMGRLNVIEDIKGFGIYDDYIYYLDREGGLFAADGDGTDRDVLLADGDLRTLLFENRTDVRILWLDEKTVVFLDSKGSLIANRLPYNFVSQGISGWNFNRRDRRLLLWTSNKIGILDFSEIAGKDEGVFERGPRVSWIYDKGRDIRECYWVNEGSHVLLWDQAAAILLELDPYSGATPYFVTSIADEAEMTYVDEIGIMYIAGGPHGKLTAYSLLPMEDRFSLLQASPEPTHEEAE